MKYTEKTVDHRSWLKRCSHRSRFDVALRLLNPESADRILDFGTGDGFMLQKIRMQCRDCRIAGYEPNPWMFRELMQRVHRFDGAVPEVIFDCDDRHHAFNKICCLEVLEHLGADSLRKAVQNMQNLLTDEGSIVVSVPIEMGLSSLLKNVVRLALGRPHPNTSLRTVAFSFLGIRIGRPNAAYIPSHIGFYYPDLEKVFRLSGLAVVNHAYSPFPLLKGLLNSQVCFLLQKESLFR